MCTVMGPCSFQVCIPVYKLTNLIRRTYVVRLQAKGLTISKNFVLIAHQVKTIPCKVNGSNIYYVNTNS